MSNYSFEMTPDQARRMRAFTAEYVALCEKHRVRVHGQDGVFVFPDEEIVWADTMEEFAAEQEETIAGTFVITDRERKRRGR